MTPKLFCVGPVASRSLSRELIPRVCAPARVRALLHPTINTVLEKCFGVTFVPRARALRTLFESRLGVGRMGAEPRAPLNTPRPEISLANLTQYISRDHAFEF